MLRFVNRASELYTLLSLAERGFYPVLYIYGPEGCGKTRLLREFLKDICGRRGFVVVYIDALESEDPRKAVMGSNEVYNAVAGLLAGYIGGGIGKAIASSISRLVSEIARGVGLRGKHVVVAVDDVAKVLGVNGVEVYMKNLLKLLEELLTSYGASTALVIATTSEGLSRDLVARHTYASVAMIWNLSKDAFKELVKQLEPPSKDVAEDTWYLTSGNPRMLLEIAIGYRWELGRWLRNLYENRIRDVELRLGRDTVVEIAEDPDAIAKYPDIAEFLIDKNLVMKISPLLGGGVLKLDREMGIGRYYAGKPMPIRSSSSADQLLRSTSMSRSAPA